MSSSKTAYVFQNEIAPNGQKAVSDSFVSDDLRTGLDRSVRRAEELAPGLGKAVGGMLRALVEGGGTPALKEGIPHAASGKCPNGSGTVKVTALPKI